MDPGVLKGCVLYIYLQQYLDRDAQFSKASLNGALYKAIYKLPYKNYEMSYYPPIRYLDQCKYSRSHVLLRIRSKT